MNIGQKITVMLAAGAVFALGMALWTAGAFAAGECGPRDQIVAVLKGKYHEEARVAGTINNMNLMEAYASERGTWTIVVTDRMGLTCVIAAGSAWDELPPMKKGKRL